jgi:hypothetical protein
VWFEHRNPNPNKPGLHPRSANRLVLWLLGHYLLAMPPSKKIASARKAAKLRSWRVSILRIRAQHLGTVEAADAKTAEVAAAEQFNLNDEQRGRLVVSQQD